MMMGLEEEKKNGDGDKYMTTCVIHAIRHESKERDNIKEILKILLPLVNPSAQDSYGRDAFMYIAMRNHVNTFHFILDQLDNCKQINQFSKIVKDNVDILGKSLVHYIINPLPYGSYENAALLTAAIKRGGFVATI
jgi:hypothetical protein